MAVATAEISDKVVDHLGMNFNREQRLEADSITKDVLRMLNYNESALCSALKRINNRFSENRIFLGNINKAKDILATPSFFPPTSDMNKSFLLQ